MSKQTDNVFVIPQEIRTQKIEWLEGTSDVMEYLRKHNFVTIDDIINRQDSIPKKICTKLKMKIIFNIPIT